MLSGGSYLVELIPCHIRQLRIVESYIVHADDSVHRSSYLMAHV